MLVCVSLCLSLKGHILFVQEYSKKAMETGDGTAVKNVLYTCVETFLRALSPFMPYLTEELYQRLGEYSPDIAESICIAQYPSPADVSVCTYDVFRNFHTIMLQHRPI